MLETPVAVDEVLMILHSVKTMQEVSISNMILVHITGTKK
jgi:hypothetical protein